MYDFCIHLDKKKMILFCLENVLTNYVLSYLDNLKVILAQRWSILYGELSIRSRSMKFLYS